MKMKTDFIFIYPSKKKYENIKSDCCTQVHGENLKEAVTWQTVTN